MSRRTRHPPWATPTKWRCCLRCRVGKASAVADVRQGVEGRLTDLAAHPQSAGGGPHLRAAAGRAGRRVQPVPQPDRTGPGASRRPRSCSRSPRRSRSSSRSTSGLASSIPSATPRSAWWTQHRDPYLDAEQKRTLLRAYESLRAEAQARDGDRSDGRQRRRSREAAGPVSARAARRGMPIHEGRWIRPCGGLLSMHSSPLAQPGVGDSGGMNVYVRELSSALAQAGSTPPRTCAGGRTTSPTRCRWSRGSGRAHRRRPSRPAQGAVVRRRRAVRRRRGRSPAGQRRDGPDPRQLLAVGRGRSSPQATTTSRSCARSTRWRVKAEGATPSRRGGASRDGDHRLCRRDSRELLGGGAPVPPPLRRPPGAPRSSRRGSSTPPPVTAWVLGARWSSTSDVRSARRPCSCSWGGSSPQGRRRRGADPGRASVARTPRSWWSGASGLDGDAEVEKVAAPVDELGPHRAGALRAASTAPPPVEPTTEPLTSCWCPAGRRASAWCVEGGVWDAGGGVRRRVGR